MEPDSLSAGSTIVTAFQSGRLIEGGAALIGWAASRDAGRTWRRGFLEYPGRVSDPVVAYDERRKTWLIAALGAAEQSASAPRRALARRRRVDTAPQRRRRPRGTV